MQFRRSTSEDLGFLKEITDAEDWGFSDLDFELMNSLDSVTCLIAQNLLAQGEEEKGARAKEDQAPKEEQKMCGTALCTQYGRLGWIGNVVVDRDYRGKGIGTELMRQAIERLRSGEADHIGLYAYDNVVEFYKALGFTQRQSIQVMFREPLEAGMDRTIEDTICVRDIKKNDLISIMDLDHEVTGLHRMPVLTKGFESGLFRGELVEVEQEIVAYQLRSASALVSEIGPCICSTTRHFHALMRLAISKDRNTLVLGIPTPNRGALGVASELGFKPLQQVHEMYIGSVWDWERPENIMAIASLHMG